MNIRPTQSEDIPGLELVLNSISLFPAEMLADMISGFLSEDESSDLWLTCESAGDVIGFCYAVPEQLTNGTWNMLAIGIQANKQGTGAGQALVKALEDALRQKGQRILIVDTSSSDEFDGARTFYRKLGFDEEASIRDFWDSGEDKVIFRKAL